MSTVFLLALIAMAGFSGASFAAIFGKGSSDSRRSYSAAVAAGILLALAFGDLFPEGLEMAGTGAITGFLAGFVLLFLAEALGRVHADHLSEGGVVKGALWPLFVGLAVHNLADGFVLGAVAGSSAAVSGLLGLGILVHQVPVGLSLAAILVAARATHATIVRATLVLGLAIPFAAVSTMALPVPDEEALGLLTGAAGGVLAYMGAAHLLPETQVGNAGRLSAVLFTGTLVVTTLALMTVLGD
ncbi:MAG: ZIP family metal transporter [Actinomycetota bacterium]|nr:ZIP family metal transporter [Actinomycetota bacterium]